MSNFEDVGQFMETFGQEILPMPMFPDKEVQDLRVELIREELDELIEAIALGDLTEVADALTDILYVTYGAGHAFGIPLDECFAEVQRSNMSKLGEDGKPMYREDGKVMKGPQYSVPDLLPILYKINK